MAVSAARIEQDQRAAAFPPQRMSTAQRSVEWLLSACLLAITLPVLACAALAVRLTSGGPVFFGHVRLGQSGRPFRCWKLRTMRVDAEQTLDDVPHLKARYVANGFKLPVSNDPRITPLGRWLRRTYLDELPQLVNVLNGSMALVGPRPIVAAELENYGADGGELLSVRPGIVGAWTARGRARPPYPERAILELAYVRSRSPGRDLRILLSAIPAILRGPPEDA